MEIKDIDWLKRLHPKWKKLKSVIEIKGKIATETRYYISSLQAHPDKILNVVRQHWGVENKLHWVLDVSFNDDQCRIRKGNAPRNIAIIKKDMLRVSLKAMRKLAG